MSKIDSLTNITTGFESQGQLNSNFDKIEDALENTLSLDGSSPNAMRANLDMNSNRIINVADPVNEYDALNKKYVDDIIRGELEGVITIIGDEDLDMDDNKIINLGAPVLDTDAANKGYVDTAIADAIVGGISGDLDMGGHSITGLADGAGATDAVALGQLGEAAFLDVGDGLEDSTGDLQVKLDGDTLTVSATGLKVTVGDGLEDDTGLEVKLDGTTLSKSASGLKVSDALTAGLSLRGALVTRSTAGVYTEVYDTDTLYSSGAPTVFTVPAGYTFAKVIHNGWNGVVRISSSANSLYNTGGYVYNNISGFPTSCVTCWVPCSEGDTFTMSYVSGSTTYQGISPGGSASIELRN